METRKLFMLGALVAGAYGGYRFLYLPYKFRQQLAAQAAARGLTPHDYLQGLGALGCQALGVSYGIPPQITGGVCNEMGGVAAALVRGLPGAIGGVGAGVGSAIGSIGGGIGSAGNSILGVGDHAVSLATRALLLPVTVQVEAVKQVGGLVADGAKGVAKGVSTVASGVGSAASSVFHKLTPW